MWVWTVIGVVALVVGLLVLLRVLGSRLPEEHVASVTLRLNQKPQVVWETISDVAGHKHWARGVTGVERLPDRDNHEVWRQRMGRNSFVLETTVCQPPVRLVRTIADDHRMFSGDWEYEVNPDGDGASVRLTEHGRVDNPVVRALMHYGFGEKATMRAHLSALAARFGEPARLV